MLPDLTIEQTYALLNAGIAFNCLIIALRLFIRAARDQDRTGARILYGLMFTSIAVCCAVLAVWRWQYAEMAPDAGLVGLFFIWLTTTAAVVYLVVWGRNGASEGASGG